ncbi:MAG: hypothetical protein GX434_02965 [Peptococcaceae bacterium]|nr:hypothetical protein [Peptococcaceae bacterium]
MERKKEPNIGSVPVQHTQVLKIILIIAAGSFLIRITQPIGSAVLNMQHPFFTQYVILFICGVFPLLKGLIVAVVTIPACFAFSF